MAQVLSDPANQNKTAEEVAEAAIAALDDMRARTHRIAVVGQISYGPQDRHTVALGPFSPRGVLDSAVKFQRATEGGTAAREIGRQLAWDSRTGRGSGRFMLAPIFRHPRDAWDFHRPERRANDWPHIAEAITRWQPGLWADEVGTGPVCQCGLKAAQGCEKHPSKAA